MQSNRYSVLPVITNPPMVHPYQIVHRVPKYLGYHDAIGRLVYFGGRLKLEVGRSQKVW